MRTFGLIGFPVSHSFSPAWFKAKFEREKISDAQYHLFPLEKIKQLPHLLEEHPNLLGLNVTIPHKQNVLEFLDSLDPQAQKVQAVNTIRIGKKEDGFPLLEGFNTDIGGFTGSLKPLLKDHHRKALVLGTGGASLAVLAGLKELGIESQLISRTPGPNQLSYQGLDKDLLEEYPLIVNTTPLGTFPSKSSPQLPYKGIGQQHLLYDLVYNPEITPFLQKGLDAGASIKNGLEMLEIQAALSWEIWNS